MTAGRAIYSIKALAGKPYRPSNGTEGIMFTERYCEQCIFEKWTHTMNDQDEKCEIFSATMIYDLDDKEYPKEWTHNENGEPICTKFKHWDWGGRNGEDLNEPIPPPIDDPNQLVFPFIIDEIVKVELETA